MRIAPFSIRRVIGSLVLGIGLFTSTFKAAAEIVISEFMASNSRTLADEDNAYPDWIELQNNGADAINLDRWTLAGSPQTPPGKRWTFPSTNLPAGGFLVVFASGKDRRQPGAPLHTGFQLNRAGDSIILRDPQGALADGAFVHPFPPQASDVSYGRGRESVDIPLITAHALGQFVVPDSGRWDDDWTSPLFLPAGWSQGAGSWGYDNRASGSLPPLSGLRQDVRKTLFGKSATAYLRIPFQVQDPATFDSLTLTVSYPDGFAAFLNGIEAVSDNRPPVLAWNSAASEARDWLADGLPRRFELSGDVLSALRVGTNWLAVQGLAIAPTNVAFILDATLTGARAASSANNLRYFTVPTPGKPNGLGTRQLGPIFSDPSPPPADPSPDQSIAVSTRVSPSFNPVTRVELRYRVMFGAEVSLPMLDDGKRQDGRARDGVYGAIIPARVASPGEMIRWYCVAEDAAGNTSRWPAFEDPKRSPAYWGTMARTNDSSTLPGFHWFVDEQNAKTASTLIGARCAVYSQGELYDNVEVRIRGQLSLYWGKQSYKFDFNPGRLFQYDPASPRVEEVNLNSTWSDKSYSRTVLAWESYRDGGTPYCRSFPMRVCQNGRFFSVAVFVEQPDERWLTRNGLDPSGSLFKMNSAMDSVSGVQKKIPRDGDLAELEALIQSISTANPNRVPDLLDQWDLPSVINYLAITAVMHDNDCVAKNYFLYHDRNRSGLWSILPWDKDLTFGHNYQSQGGLSDEIWADYDRTNSLGADHPLASPSHPLFGERLHQKENGQWNRLVDLIYQFDPARQMYLRRLRTVMDALLQPPETPRGELRYEQRMDSLLHAARDDAAMDRVVSGSPAYGLPQDMATALRLLETDYLSKRRFHLYVRHNETNAARVSNSARIPEPPPPTAPPLRFAQVDRLPLSGNPLEEFVEILNPSSFAWDISGWSVRGLIGLAFPPGTVIPPAHSLFLCRDARAFRRRALPPHGRMGLFVLGDYQGSLGSEAGAIELASGALVVARLELEDRLSDAQRFLRVQRIQYHHGEDLPSSPDLEYLELRHAGPAPLDLDGVRFTRGIRFSFATGAVHRIPAPVDRSDPQRSVIVVKNLKAFTAHYGVDPRVAGEYEGHLNNSGDALRLEDSRGQAIQEFHYRPEWLPLTDGVGFPLIHDPESPPESWSDPLSWRMGVWEGLPGPLPQWAQAPMTTSAARIREILLTSASDGDDAVTIDANVDTDIEGWFLSDSILQPKKFRVPSPALVRSNKPVVLTSRLWGRASGALPGFRLNPDGGDVFLFSADPEGRLTGYFHRAHYGSGLPGNGFLRQEEGLREFWLRENAASITNALEAIALQSLTITEIHYHPPSNTPGVDNTEDEYLELHNPTPSTALLLNPSTPAWGWRIRGSVEFELPRTGTIPPGGHMIVVPFDPLRDSARLQAMRSRFVIPARVAIVGPWLGTLPNSGGDLILEAPALDRGQARYVEMDRVAYSSGAPWPSEPDGMGASLSRRDDRVAGVRAGAWTATAPSAGQPYEERGSPVILISPGARVASAFSDVLMGVLAGPDKELGFQWRHDGIPIPGGNEFILDLRRAELSDAGVYDVLVMGRGGVAWSERGNLVIQQPPTLYDIPSLPLAVAGTNYSLSVGAIGEGALRYQWKKNGAWLPDKTNSSLLLPAVTGETEGSYSVVVSDARGETESPAAPVRVVYAPELLWPPESQMVNIGETIRLRAALAGTPPFGYLWRKDGLNLRRPSQDALTITNAQLTNAGVYSILVSNIATTRFVALPQKANVLVLGDTDGDGMPDIWELTYQLRYNDPSDAGVDSDFDGMTNLQEYRAGTNPRDPSDFLRLTIALDRSLAALQATLRFTAISNRSYTLQTSDRPGAAWSSWMDLPAQQTNKPISIPIDLSGGGPQRQFRLRIP